MIIKDYFELLFPWLFVTLLIVSVSSNFVQLQRGWQKFMVLAFSALITLAPFFGLSLAEYLLSINPNFSIGSLALVLVLLWPKIFDKPLLSDKNLCIFCSWNVVLSLAFFSSYLGLINYDLYAHGYSFSLGFIAMALITLITVWDSNPLSLIFIAYIAAFNLKLFPSSNFFDYITDGFLFIMSVVVIFFLTCQNRFDLKGVLCKKFQQEVTSRDGRL